MFCSLLPKKCESCVSYYMLIFFLKSNNKTDIVVLAKDITDDLGDANMNLASI